MIAGMPKNIFYLVLAVGTSPIMVGSLLRVPITILTFLYPVILILALAFVVRLVTKRNPLWHIDFVHARQYPRRLSPHLTQHSSRIQHNG
jgi:hypothetical protein